MITLFMTVALLGGQDPVWWSGLEIGAWTPQAGSEGAAMFTQPYRGTGNRLWVRYEYREAQSGIRSERSLVEIDCRDRRVRTVQVTSFRDSNLSGPQVPSYSAGNWTYEAPGTVGDAIVTIYCG